MIAILHHYDKSITLDCLLNLSVTSQGFMCEVNGKKSTIVDVVEQLKKKGFEVSLVGKQIMVTLSSFFVFDETAENK